MKISCQNPHPLSSSESGRYDLQMVTFQRFRNGAFIADIETPLVLRFLYVNRVHFLSLALSVGRYSIKIVVHTVFNFLRTDNCSEIFFILHTDPKNRSEGQIDPFSLM